MHEGEIIRRLAAIRNFNVVYRLVSDCFTVPGILVNFFRMVLD